MKNILVIKYDGQKEPFWYIRLGFFLDYIKNEIIYQIEESNNLTSPILDFDTDIESNLMFVEDLQVSVDPNICVINRTLNIEGIDHTFTEQYANSVGSSEPFISPLLQEKGYRCYGQIMNIYVHMKWILIKLDELKDANTNKVVLVDFLNNLLSSINSALGGMNNLEANIDETSNSIIIRDQNPLPNFDKIKDILNTYYKTNKIPRKISDTSANFDLFRYKNTNNILSAGFIKDFSFTTELSPDTSTMLTIGATANSTVVGENSTAFSRFNTGLKDRYKTEIITPNQKFPEKADALEIISQTYDQIYKAYINYLIQLSDQGGHKYNDGDGETYKDALSSYLTALQQLRAALDIDKKVALPGTGFIPFNMSVVMDGLSGMKIYNKFNIDTEFLPYNYPDNAEFLIKNMVHKIENSKWTTTLESFITIKGEYEDRENSNINPLLEKAKNLGIPRIIPPTDPFDTYLNFNKFVYPVTTNAGSPIGLRPNPFNQNIEEYHNGYDLEGGIDQVIYSVCDGTVIQVGASGFGPYAILVQVSKLDYKNPLMVENVYIWYGHNNSTSVKAGDPIKKGQEIATVGNQGLSTGPHLHFEIFLGINSNDKKIIIDPKKYFGDTGTKLTGNAPFSIKSI